MTTHAPASMRLRILVRSLLLGSLAAVTATTACHKKGQVIGEEPRPRETQLPDRAGAIAEPRSAGGQDPTKRVFRFPDEVQSEKASDMARVRASRVPGDIRFVCESTATIRERTLLLEGRLINEGRSIDIFVFPVSGYYPFAIEPAADSGVRRKPDEDPPPPPPVPPAPLRIEVPQRSEIIFQAGLNLSEYEWTPSADVEFEWMFHTWNEPRPSGRIKVRMPAR